MEEKWKRWAKVAPVRPATDEELENYLGSLNSYGDQVYNAVPR